MDVKAKSNMKIGTGNEMKSITFPKSVSETDRNTDLKLTRLVKRLNENGFPIISFGLPTSVRYSNSLKNLGSIKLTPQTGVIDFHLNMESKIGNMVEFLNNSGVEVLGSEYNNLFDTNVIIIYVSVDNF